jgi:Trk K+ transport system NAD-binding subunit
MSAADGPERAPVLVCGLGAFGQAVIGRLLPFGIPLRLLDRATPDWLMPDWAETLQPLLTLGDMRKPQALRLAGAVQARSVLLLSSDGGINVEAALQVRLLNAAAEIVIRSSGDLDDLGSLLEQRLPKLAVVNPQMLSAGALVQALRPGSQLARFEVQGETFEVRETPLEDHRFQRPIRLEGAAEGQGSLLVMPLRFYAPQPRRHGGPGQTLVSLLAAVLRKPVGAAQAMLRWARQSSLLQRRLVAVVLLMALAGIRLFGAQGADGWVQGLFVTSALLKGDYVDPTNVVLGPTGGPHAGDGVLVTTTLLYSLVGTLLSSALVALILDQLLLARFGARRMGRLRREAQPILLVGGGSLAHRVAQILGMERHEVVRVEAQAADRQGDDRSLFVPTLEQARLRLRGRAVRSVALLSGQLLADVQGTLELQDLWPKARFALLARSEGTEDRLGNLLGGASVISPIELGADVVVATAFGERVEGVWRIQGQNLLQVRYRVCPGDTLVGNTVSRLDHGYGLTVLSLQRSGQPRPLAIPAHGTLLAVGDQLVVLASLPALQRLEQGRIRPPASVITLHLPQPLTPEMALTLQQSLARRLGMAPAEASALLHANPSLRLPVDPDCGALLLRDLQHQAIRVRLESEAGATVGSD